MGRSLPWAPAGPGTEAPSLLSRRMRQSLIFGPCLQTTCCGDRTRPGPKSSAGWALKLHGLDLQQRPPVGPIFHCGPPLARWPSERRGRPRPLWRLNYQPLSPCWALRLTTMAHRPPQATSTSSHGQHCQPPISLSFSCGATQQRSLCGTMRSGLPTILLCTS